jgi:hypothetical protein
MEPNALRRLDVASCAYSGCKVSFDMRNSDRALPLYLQSRKTVQIDRYKALNLLNTDRRTLSVCIESQEGYYQPFSLADTMKLSSTLQLFCLAGFALSHPNVLGKTDDIPDGAFPSPASSSASLSPVPTSTTSTPAPTDARLGRAIIVNHCEAPIYIWSVGTVIRDPVALLPGSRYGETFRQDHKAGGIAIKISTEEGGLYNSAPLTIFAYNVNGQNVWYDLSDVFGDPFNGHPVVLSPADPPISWANGIQPSGSQVRVRDLSEDLTLTLC